MPTHTNTAGSTYAVKPDKTVISALYVTLQFQTFDHLSYMTTFLVLNLQESRRPSLNIWVPKFCCSAVDEQHNSSTHCKNASLFISAANVQYK